MNDMVPVAAKKTSELERWASVLEIAPAHALTEAITIEYKSPAGLHIPQQAKTPKPSFFRVLKMGAGCMVACDSTSGLLCGRAENILDCPRRRSAGLGRRLHKQARLLRRIF